MHSSGCSGCSLGNTEKPSCSYGTATQPFLLIKAPTPKKAAKGVLLFQRKGAACGGHPALHLPCWGSGLHEQTQGIQQMVVNFKLGMVITFAGTVILPWVSKSSSPHQHIPAAFREPSLSYGCILGTAHHRALCYSDSGQYKSLWINDHKAAVKSKVVTLVPKSEQSIHNAFPPALWPQYICFSLIHSHLCSFSFQQKPIKLLLHDAVLN